MNFKLLALTCLIVSLAVTPTFAQSVFRVHTTYDVTIPNTKTVYFGDGIYLWCWLSTMKVTAFFEDDLAGLSWFNYTVNGASWQEVYNSAITATCVYMNGVNYTEGASYDPLEWYEELGIVYLNVRSGASFPANVSISYPIPVAPGEETVSITVVSHSFNTTTNNTAIITAGTVIVEDDFGNSSTLTLPAMFSLIKGQTYTLTFQGDADWSFYGYASPYMLPIVANSTYRDEFETDTTINVFFTAVEEVNWLPVPIIFIIGMVGLGCLFVGPVYGLNKMMHKEYRNGLVWGVIITALGFALFISWLFGGVF